MSWRRRDSLRAALTDLTDTLMNIRKTNQRLGLAGKAVLDDTHR
jgi:hypothetical protein